MSQPKVRQEEQIKNAVLSRYGQVAESVLNNLVPASGCCGPSEFIVSDDMIPLAAASVGCCSPASGEQTTGYAGNLYARDELTGLPASVTGASLGCGNPMAIAALQPGQTVLDLGSGGGIDCFLAARQVGSGGQVIGLDMTPEMLELAERNKANLGPAAANVSFKYGQIEAMPLDDASVDVIISNCVINLSADKDAVFREAYRVLRPGGYLAVSDIVTLQPMSSELLADVAAWSGCVAGALDVDDYTGKLRAAGFEQVTVSDLVPTDFGISEGAQGDGVSAADSRIPGGLKAWIASAKVVAHKPAAAR